VEDRTSELEDKIDIKEKNGRILRQKTQQLQKNMKELSNSIKRPNCKTEKTK
jgi:hypothetical protein